MFVTLYGGEVFGHKKCPNFGTLFTQHLNKNQKKHKHIIITIKVSEKLQLQ